jgi:mRNA-degrading endonuclease RelE of RelBE toxin-antitoxin system
MYSIIFHPEADAELLESVEWYEKQNKGLGTRFFLSVKEVLTRIQNRPETFGYARRPFREASVIFFPYTIVYKMNKLRKTVYVSAIYHTSRNPKKKFRR